MHKFTYVFSEKAVKKYVGTDSDLDKWETCYLSDDYMYLEYIDEGGYGSIHEVMDRFTGQRLVLKHSSKKDFRKGLSNISTEAEFMILVCNKLGGLKLYRYYENDDHYILIMDNGGTSLENMFSQHRKKIHDLLRYDAYKTNFFYNTYLQRVKECAINVFQKIKAIHNLGIHHNDLKPENILISSTNRPKNYTGLRSQSGTGLMAGSNEKLESIVIIDFGVAKLVEPSYNTFRGTLEYIPYEYVATGSYKPWDHSIWCFGVMLHFLTLMKHPFSREEEVLAHKLDWTLINKLPDSFANLIVDCLNKDPNKRPLNNMLERLQTLSTSG
jgi:serine/threonine protein kinase